MEFGTLVFLVYLVMPATLAEDVSYQACVDKYSRKGYQPWQEWSDHYTCHRYRCEIRDGKYFIAAVGCRKPKIPENALECHEYIEDENVEFPTCCARLRCVVEANGERIVQTRGQPGELFPDKPWKGQQSEPNPAVLGMVQQNTVNGEPQSMQAPQAAPAIFNSRGVADNNNNERRSWKGIPIESNPASHLNQPNIINDHQGQMSNPHNRVSEIEGDNRFMDSFSNTQELHRKKRYSVFNRELLRDNNGYQPQINEQGSFFPTQSHPKHNNSYLLN